MRQTFGNNFSDTVSSIPPTDDLTDDSAGAVKSWTVPDNEQWLISSACVRYIASGVAGNRLFVIKVFKDNSEQLKHLVPAIVQTAGQDFRYCVEQGTYRETAVAQGVIHMPIPANLWLKGGYEIRFTDNNAVDLDGDHIQMALQIERFVV